MNLRNHTARQYRSIRKILRGNPPEVFDHPPEMSLTKKILFTWGITGLVILGSCRVCHAQELTASWYSIESLKKEGTWAYSHGRMANGKMFKDENLTCATRLWPISTTLRITSLETNESIIVKVTDRISKRLSHKRIDLSKRAFERIDDTNKGIIKVNVEVIK